MHLFKHSCGSPMGSQWSMADTWATWIHHRSGAWTVQEITLDKKGKKVPCSQRQLVAIMSIMSQSRSEWELTRRGKHDFEYFLCPKYWEKDRRLNNWLGVERQGDFLAGVALRERLWLKHPSTRRWLILIDYWLLFPNNVNRGWS